MYKVCNINMKVKEFDQSSTLLLPGQIDLLTDTELSMYFIQSWELTFVSKSCTVVHCPPLPLQPPTHLAAAIHNNPRNL